MFSNSIGSFHLKTIPGSIALYSKDRLPSYTAIIEFNNVILQYCTAGQICIPSTVFEPDGDNVRPLFDTKKKTDSQANVVLSQNLKEILKKHKKIAVNEEKLQYRRARADNAIKIIVCKPYRRVLLYHGHCSMLARYPGKGRKRYSLRSTENGRHMISNVQKCVFKFESWWCHEPPQGYRHSLQLFPRTSSLRLVAVNIVKLLTKTTQVILFTVVMTDRYSKLTRAVLVPNQSALHVAVVAFKYLVVPYCISRAITTDSGPQFLSKFFAELCPETRTKLTTAT